MRSSHNSSLHSAVMADSRLVPIKNFRSVRCGATDRQVGHVGKNLIGEPQEIFGGQRSKSARTMLAEIDRVARRPYNILITGETGTGKTIAAREIHRRSKRANRPFMELNCANLPEQLVEAELFGYRKGAFTGADRDHGGLFEEATGGILFLDEIGDVPLTTQNRLLKAIDEKQIKRLGNNHYVFCDVQVIAATSRNLLSMIHNGEFREDLFCRLVALAKLNSRRGSNCASKTNSPGSVPCAELAGGPPEFFRGMTMMPGVRKIDSAGEQSFLRSIAREGDIILPLELCLLRRGETFKQWTARAKRCSIEAARHATGGMESAAERLGLTCNSLRGHLKRARRTQDESLFNWRRQPD